MQQALGTITDVDAVLEHAAQCANIVAVHDPDRCVSSLGGHQLGCCRERPGTNRDCRVIHINDMSDLLAVVAFFRMNLSTFLMALRRLLHLTPVPPHTQHHHQRIAPHCKRPTGNDRVSSCRSSFIAQLRGCEEEHGGALGTSTRPCNQSRVSGMLNGEGPLNMPRPARASLRVRFISGPATLSGTRSQTSQAERV